MLFGTNQYLHMVSTASFALLVCGFCCQIRHHGLIISLTLFVNLYENYIKSCGGNISVYVCVCRCMCVHAWCARV